MIVYLGFLPADVFRDACFVPYSPELGESNMQSTLLQFRSPFLKACSKASRVVDEAVSGIQLAITAGFLVGERGAALAIWKSVRIDFR